MTETQEYRLRDHFVLTAHSLRDRLIAIHAQMRQRTSIPMFLVDDISARIREAGELIAVVSAHRDEVERWQDSNLFTVEGG